jgi:hypothetical protein
MQYIKKLIEIGTTGHFNECWECDFKTVNLNAYPNISINMIGRKSYDDRLAGKNVSETKNVTVTVSDLQLSGAIGYANIPKLYEVLTTKTIEEIYTEEETMTEDGVYNGMPYQAGSIITVGKTRDIPVYPEFFDGEIINVI